MPPRFLLQQLEQRWEVRGEGSYEMGGGRDEAFGGRHIS